MSTTETTPQSEVVTQSQPSSRRLDAALLIVRIAVALPALYHGSAILFGAFGGPGLKGFSSFTHLPLAVAALVGLAQFAGGLALLTGVLARIGGASIVIVFTGAIFLVHIHNGFDITKGGFEYVLTLALAGLSILVAGAGNYTLTAFLPAAFVQKLTFARTPSPA